MFFPLLKQSKIISLFFLKDNNVILKTFAVVFHRVPYWDHYYFYLHWLSNLNSLYLPMILTFLLLIRLVNVSKKATNELEIISNWFKANKLSLKPDKTDSYYFNHIVNHPRIKP